MPLRCGIDIPLLLYSHRCVILCRIEWWYGAEVVLYISGVGFCVARFDRQGNAKASDREASNSAGLHAFFMSCLNGS